MKGTPFWKGEALDERVLLRLTRHIAAGRRKRVQGGEALQVDRDSKSGYPDPENAVAALPEAYFEPVYQLEWEHSILWEPSADSAQVHFTQLNLDEEEEEESEAEIGSTGAAFFMHDQVQLG